MHYSREEAMVMMNKWGHENMPFLFVVDFEMSRVRLFRLDQGHPFGLKFSFPGFNEDKLPRSSKDFLFEKYPIPYQVYKVAFNKVIQEIYAGNSFLLNLTFPTKVHTDLSLADIYQFAKCKYKLLVNNEFVVFSPETFIQIENGMISSNPMKGTINSNIANAKERIMSDEKEKAEHSTIVDLIRNDLSKVSSAVRVRRFRYIDEILTDTGGLLQVSSEIEGILSEKFHENIGDILFALLPAGSVTGAPKEKTVKIIKSVELTERGYYTGVFGYFKDRKLDSAVMIRFIENQDNVFWFRSGGGITHLSQVENEYNELIEKVYVPFVRNHQDL